MLKRPLKKTTLFSQTFPQIIITLSLGFFFLINEMALKRINKVSFMRKLLRNRKKKIFFTLSIVFFVKFVVLYHSKKKKNSRLFYVKWDAECVIINGLYYIYKCK